MTILSDTRGGAITSLDMRTVHSALPSASNASTSPLSVPTTTSESPAPGPADSGRPALTRQSARPVAGSSRVSVPSFARGVDRRRRHRRRNPGPRRADAVLPVDPRRDRCVERRHRSRLLAAAGEPRERGHRNVAHPRRQRRIGHARATRQQRRRGDRAAQRTCACGRVISPLPLGRLRGVGCTLAGPPCRRRRRLAAGGTAAPQPRGCAPPSASCFTCT